MKLEKAVAHLAVFLHISQAEDFFDFSRSSECYSIVISSLIGTSRDGLDPEEIHGIKLQRHGAELLDLIRTSRGGLDPEEIHGIKLQRREAGGDFSESQIPFDW
ncbi:uncharacterized protein LOC126591558 isoform X1 [Malus sylvestris]|uniref:uncharacterized protein LOC126591558 isoform X1 n=1 Tax=Malus sylvestris TaxID=3752 RepID=UPI0021AC5EF3|nr:uncharacterized protein LOC126591558 isoform X1 [Malus sylvestris]